MIKRVQFAGRRNGPAPAEIDHWVQNRGQQPGEKIKRLTVDVPISLHRRIKSQCALDNVIMADAIRDLLYERFGEREQAAESSAAPAQSTGEGAAS